jgi:anti-sigma B factor antagonist
LDIKTEVANGVTVHRIVGRIDAWSSPNLVTAARSGMAVPWVIYDMRQVTYISSAGLRGILVIAKEAAAAHGGLAAFGLQASVTEVFASSGFEDIIPITSDETQARAALAAQKA